MPQDQVVIAERLPVFATDANHEGWPWPEKVHGLPPRMPDGAPWPRITIVTPSYNQGPFIEETIRSVLLQGYPNLEYIVIDGGSSDESVEVIRKYERWISYWASESDSGQADALNKGFARATGDIFGFLNSDDTYTPGALEAVAVESRKARASEIALICGAVQDWDGSTLSSIEKNTEFGSIREWLDREVSLHQPGCFWTRAAWNTCGPFPARLHYIFDRYFFTRCNAARGRMLSIPKVLALFRLHPDSKTSKNAIDQSLFVPEWDSVKAELEQQLSLHRRLRLNFDRYIVRNVRLNWKLVGEALKDSQDGSARRALWSRLKSNPMWLLHRPVAAAAFRLAVKRPAGWTSSSNP